MTTRPDPVTTTGIRLIILFKLVKGFVETTTAMVLGLGPSLGLSHALVAAALTLQHHVTRAWALNVSRILSTLVTPGHLRLAALALLLDGSVAFVEAWGLRRGHWWGPWLVVLVTGSLLPFELVHLAHLVTATRVIVLLVNALIVAYLAWRVHVGHGQRRMPTPGALSGSA